jgi:hypothetical protein
MRPSCQATNWLIGLAATCWPLGLKAAGSAETLTEQAQQVSPAPSKTTNQGTVALKPKSPRSGSTGQSASSTTRTQDFYLDVDDDVQIRLQQSRPALDEKGRSKRYTSAELNRLNGGRATIPGYPGEFSDLKPGQVVTLYLLERTEPAGDRSTKKRSANVKEKPAGQLTGTVMHVDERKRKLKIHTESTSQKGSTKARLSSKDAGNGLLAYYRISVILIATKAPPTK